MARSLKTDTRLGRMVRELPPYRQFTEGCSSVLVFEAPPSEKGLV